MKSLILFLALVLGSFAAPAPAACANQNVTVSGGWYYPLRAQTPNCQYTWTFNFPSDSYANLRITVNGGTGYDYVTVYDYFGSSFDLFAETDLMINWPTQFLVSVKASNSSALSLGMNINLRKLVTGSTSQVTTRANNQPSLIYVSDFKAGTSFTFTSNSSSNQVVVLPAITFIHGTVQERARLNNFFLYDGGVLMGTLSRLMDRRPKWISITNSVTLYNCQQTDLKGAIFVTDYDNIANLTEFSVQYVPLNSRDGSAYASVAGGNNQPKNGAVTIIGEKGGKTPITIRQLTLLNGSTGQFSYLNGGPLANYAGLTSPLTNSALPRTMSGTLTTFMLSQGQGTVNYSI